MQVSSVQEWIEKTLLKKPRFNSVTLSFDDEHPRFVLFMCTQLGGKYDQISRSLSKLFFANINSIPDNKMKQHCSRYLVLN